MWIIHLTRQWRLIHKSWSRIKKCNYESCFKGGSIPQGTRLAKSLTCYRFRCDTVCSYHASNNVENSTRRVPLVWAPIDVWDNSIIIFSRYDILVTWYFYCGICQSFEPILSPHCFSIFYQGTYMHGWWRQQKEFSSTFFLFLCKIYVHYKLNCTCAIWELNN